MFIRKDSLAVLVLFLLTLLVSSTTHLVNRSALEKDGIALRGGIAVITSDDAAYLVPPLNWLAGKGWRSNDPGVAAYVSRSPGYGILYAAFLMLWPPDGALLALLVLQFLAFALAVALLPRLARDLGMTRGLSYFIAVLVAVLPTFSGFLSYTLTEGIVPSLIIISVFFTSREQFNCRVLGCMSLGFLFLVRPAMLPWTIAVVWVIYTLLQNRKHLLALVTLVLAFGPVLWWQYRSYDLAGQVVGLHPIYHWDSNDLYRPTHEAIWNFHKMWGQDGVSFHHTMLSFWEAALHCRGVDEPLGKAMSRVPAEVRNIIGNEALVEAYTGYYRSLQVQIPYFEAGLAMPAHPEAYELKVVDTFTGFRQRYVRARPLHAYLLVPARVYFVDMAAHSNLSLYIFQGPFRGKWWMEGLRWLSASMHMALFVLFPFAFVLGFRQKWWSTVALPVALYLGYLAFVQRGVEERYTLPVLAPMLLCVVFILQQGYIRLRRRQGLSGIFSPPSRL